MRDNSYDRTIQRNYLQKWRFLIPEYEAVKAGRSEAFRRVGDFFRHHGTCSQTFRKYYNRYLRSGAEADLLPQRRGAGIGVDGHQLTLGSFAIVSGQRRSNNERGRRSE